jgi:hypothetical protein
MPGQAAAPSAPLDLEALKEGRTPRSYQLSPGKMEAFYGMMSRGDIPVLVQMDGDHIIIWGTDDEHAVYRKFVKIVDGDGQKRSMGAGNSSARTLTWADGEGLSKAATEAQRAAKPGAEKAAVEQYRSALQAAMRDRETTVRAAEKAREEAETIRARTAEQRDREAELARSRRDLDAAASTLRSRNEILQAESRTTEQRVRELERQIRQMEERAQRLEKQMDEQGRKPVKNKKSSAAEHSEGEDTTSSSDLEPTLAPPAPEAPGT